MISAWKRLSNDQRFAWSLVSGAIIAGSIIKVGYFKFSRNLMLNDTEKRQQENLGHLKEAYEYSKWSRNDREQRLPPLTPEQREQMRQYLEIVQQHGLSKGFQNQNEDCEGCPVLKQGRKILGIPSADQ